MQRAKNFRDKRRPSPLNVDLAKENGIQVFFVVFSVFFYYIQSLRKLGSQSFTQSWWKVQNLRF